MDEVTLQITVSGAGRAADVAKLVDTAMAMREPEVHNVVPAGYRCQECYSGDGSHQTTCSYHGVTGP